MEEYKVRYEKLDGFHVSDWMEENEARKFFNKLKNEKTLVTIWAELCKEDEVHDDIDVIDFFERKVVNFLGHDMIV